MRGLLRFVVVGFTVVSLLLVAAVGVSASSGKAGTDTLKNSVVSVFSAHFDQAGANKEKGNGNGDKEKGNGNGEGNGGGGDKCKPPKKEHTEATEDHDNDKCGHKDKGSD